MPESPEGLLARLATAGIAAETRHHPPVFTVAESRDLIAELPGGHTKNRMLTKDPLRGRNRVGADHGRMTDSPVADARRPR